MRHRRSRRFRHSQNGRSFQHRRNDMNKPDLGRGSFTSSRMRNNFNTPQNAERLIEKYNNLAKEALSSGDKILSENYLQHVDHFERLVSLKNANQNEKSSQDLNETKEQNNEANSDSQNNQGTIDKK